MTTGPLSATMRHLPGTFSIAAREPETGTFGAAVTTGTVAVGATCPHVSANAAVLTQAFTRVDHGRDAVTRIDAGEPVDEACRGLLDADEHAAYRQLHGVDREGEFAFTGDRCVEWCGSRVGEDYTVAGNMLAGPEVVDAVADAYEEADGDVPARLLAALRAGEDAGGDDRGELSAAILVHALEPMPYHNLRVDCSETPIDDLATLLAEARRSRDRLEDETAALLEEGYPPELLEFGVKY